jgi:signal transduction histidine kinase
MRYVDGALKTEIQDEGAGFDPVKAMAAAKSYGLTGMRERVNLLHGCFRITSAPGAGTTVLASIPVAEAALKGVGRKNQ